MKKVVLILIGLLTILAICRLFIIKRAPFVGVPFVPNGITVDKGKFPITGIDVSAHTGKINFSEISKQKIDFVFLKATEGKSFVDPTFEENYRNASSHGLKVGFYHFFRFNKDGTAQAENFLRRIKGKKTTLPLVIDVEEWGNGNLLNKSTDNVIREIRAFITTVEKKSGKKVMVYSNESSYKKYIRGRFDKNDLWICSFSKSPKVGKKWTLWQHSHKGTLVGANGWIDINTFNGNRKEWSNYLRKQS